MTSKTTEIKKESTIEISPLSQKLLEHLDSLSSILTTEEMEIFHIIYLKRKPMTTREVRVEYILNKISNLELYILREDGLFEKNQKEVIDEYKEKIKQFLQEKDIIHKKLERKEISNTEYIKLLENLIKKHKELKLNIFSYEKIENILKSFRQLGITAIRRDPFKNAKYLWIINPEFSKALYK